MKHVFTNAQQILDPCSDAQQSADSFLQFVCVHCSDMSTSCFFAYYNCASRTSFKFFQKNIDVVIHITLSKSKMHQTGPDKCERQQKWIGWIGWWKTPHLHNNGPDRGSGIPPPCLVPPSLDLLFQWGKCIALKALRRLKVRRRKANTSMDRRGSPSLRRQINGVL